MVPVVASEVGLGAVALAPLPGHRRDSGGSRDDLRRATFSAKAADLRAVSSELDGRPPGPPQGNRQAV